MDFVEKTEEFFQCCKILKCNLVGKKHGNVFHCLDTDSNV